MRRKQTDDNAEVAELDRLIAAITADLPGDDAQLRAFHAAIRAGVTLPCDALVIGEPVMVSAFDYDGRPRRDRRNETA